MSFTSRLTLRTDYFFADFAPFADIVNEGLADEFTRRWRIQALSDEDVSLNADFSDGPIFGRCYAVFYNQVELGKLEIRPGIQYTSEIRKVITEIELHSVRLLHFDQITEFLGTISMYVCYREAEYEKNEYHSDANQAIITALTKTLWSCQEITEYSDLDGQGWG